MSYLVVDLFEVYGGQLVSLFLYYITFSIFRVLINVLHHIT